MIDIIFIVLVFLIFLIGSSNYENFESVMTPEDEMYQSNQVTALTDGLDENITGTLSGISSMVSSLTGEIQGKVNERKKWIEGCAGKRTFTIRVPYGSRCSRRHCWSYRCRCGWRGCKSCSKCKTIYYGCTKWRNQTKTVPQWKC